MGEWGWAGEEVRMPGMCMHWLINREARSCACGAWVGAPIGNQAVTLTCHPCRPRARPHLAGQLDGVPLHAPNARHQALLLLRQHVLRRVAKLVEQGLDLHAHRQDGATACRKQEGVLG